MTDNADHRVVTFKDAAQRDAYNAAFRAAWADAVAKGLMPSKPREFLGTYPCMCCGRRVRVYDWLPSMLLCASCAKKEQQHEDNAAEGEDNND